MAVSVIRTIILYAVILTMLRIMGKRQISELQTSELVVTLLISNNFLIKKASAFLVVPPVIFPFFSPVISE